VDDPGRLSSRARRTIETATEVGVCSISCYEVAAAVERRRLVLDPDPHTWIGRALAVEPIVLLELSPEVAVEAAQIDRRKLGGDAGDRIIYATARSRGAQLVTKDKRLRAFDRAATIW
jgi:PIN domain nuclease of toxin-antitoxin system